MINASFSSSGRDAAISGAFQYDTGQRLRMHGLPSPDEFLAKDEHLSGGMVTVEAQFSFMGDEKTEARPATWDAESEVWTVAVPDVYLRRYADVHLYVYVSYGQTDKEMRAKTVYEAVFRPISRPAPGGEVTENQKDEWQGFKDEINLKLTEAGTAISGANAAKEAATDAANAANAAAEKAIGDVSAYLSFLGRTDVTAERIEPYADPTVKVEKKTDDEGNEYTLVTFGVPQSVVTVNDRKADDKGNIALTYDDVGALPKDHRASVEITAEIPSGGWTKNGNYYYKQIDVAGILASDEPIVDINITTMADWSETAVAAMQKAWANVVKVETANGSIRAYAYKAPTAVIPIKLLCVR